MPSFMELIYIDSDDQARQTGLQRAADSDAATWAEFRRYRRYGVDIKQAKFLLDYHRDNGDWTQTIALDATGFTAITGQPVKADADYRKIDEDFWREVTRARDKERRAA